MPKSSKTVRCRVLCAFEEPHKPSPGGYFVGVYPGQEIDIPAELVDLLVSCKHVERMPVEDAPEEAPEPELPLDEAQVAAGADGAASGAAVPAGAAPAA